MYSVIAEGNCIYVGGQFNPYVAKVHIPTWSLHLNFAGHSNPVNTLSLYCNILFSGSNDRTIICWNTENASMFQKYIGHTDFVYSVAVFNNELYSCGNNWMIIKWNMQIYLKQRY